MCLPQSDICYPWLVSTPPPHPSTYTPVLPLCPCRCQQSLKGEHLKTKTRKESFVKHCLPKNTPFKVLLELRVDNRLNTECVCVWERVTHAVAGRVLPSPPIVPALGWLAWLPPLIQWEGDFSGAIGTIDDSFVYVLPSYLCSLLTAPSPHPLLPPFILRWKDVSGGGTANTFAHNMQGLVKSGKLQSQKKTSKVSSKAGRPHPHYSKTLSDVNMSSWTLTWGIYIPQHASHLYDLIIIS